MRLAKLRCRAAEAAPLLHRRGRHLWTSDADAYLQRHARCCRSTELARRLGVTGGAVRDRIYGLGKRGTFPRYRWASQEDDELRRLAGTLSVADLAEHFGRTVYGIRLHTSKLGVSLLPAWGWSDGYRIKRTRGLKRHEHREVMAGALGRPLDSAERVHHINLVKHDNRRENLHVCRGDGEHLAAHRSLERLVPALLERGVIDFDCVTGVYRLVGQTDR